LVSARRSKLETDARNGSRGAAMALRLSDEPNRFLSTTQTGITLISILNGLYSGKAFAHGFAAIIARIDALAPYALTIATASIVIAVTYFTIIFGELVPKRLGLSNAERMAKAIARPMLAFSVLMAPAVWVLGISTTFMLKLLNIKDDEEKVTEEEIKTLVKEGLDVGEVQEVEHDIVGRVFNLGDRDIDSIMTHRSDFVWLAVTDDRDTIRGKVLEDMHDVYPVQNGNHDEILGAVYLKDLFGHIDSADFSLEEIMRTPRYLPDNKSVYGALESFKENGVKYSFVIDEFGDIKGIVTVSDIMEALVGEVVEEGEEKDIIEREDGSLLVSGQCSFYSFLETLDMEELYASHDYNTISGLILEELERIPEEGEKLSWHGLELEIMDMDGARIDKVLVSRAPADEEVKV